MSPYFLKNFFIFIVMSLSLLLSACSADTRVESNPSYKVAIIVHNKDDVFLSLISKAIEKRLPHSIQGQFIESKGDASLQEQQVFTLLEEDIDLIAINAVELPAIPNFIDKIREKGIPVVFFNREPTVEDLNSYNKAMYVGTAPSAAGVLQGQIIKKIWDRRFEKHKNHTGSFQYLMLQGSPYGQDAIVRTEYAINQSKALGVPMRQVRQTYFCNWDRASAKEAMQSALKEGVDDIDLIIANSDALALGAIDALEEIGYNKKNGPASKFLPIIGVDALPDALQAIKDKRMSATVKQDANEVGRVIETVIENALFNKEYNTGTGYNWDESGKCIYVPFSLISNQDQ